MATLETWDYVSLTVVVALSCVLGLYHVYTARKSTATRDFLVTNTQLGTIPLILSIVATVMSATGLLGLSKEVYVNGLSFAPYILQFLVTAPLAAFLYLPVFYKLNRITIFEYLELRFCSIVRTGTSVLLSIQLTLYTAIVIYAPALALNQVTGLNLWASVISIGTVCMIYTSMGGLKAVVWADVCQLVVMIVVLVVMIVKGTIDVGGMDVVWSRLAAGGRADMFIWKIDPNYHYTIWTVMVAAPIYFLPAIVLNQPLMQRYLSNKSLTRAQVSLFGGAAGMAFVVAATLFCAVLIYARYYDCDPLLNGQIKNHDQLIALYALETLSFCKGLTGVFIAGLLCATLSTLSSMLNSMAAVTISDYIRPCYPQLSERTSMTLSKIITVLYGVLCMGLVSLVEMFGGILKMLFNVFSLTGGPVLLVYTVGMLLPWINTKGVLCGVVASLILPWWAWIGNMYTSPYIPHAPYSVDGCSNITLIPNVDDRTIDTSFLIQFYSLSPMWYTAWSLIVGLIASLLISLITGFQDPNKVHPDLLFPIVHRFIKPRHVTLTTPEIFRQKPFDDNYVVCNGRKNSETRDTVL